jgi:hypothetical protein
MRLFRKLPGQRAAAGLERRLWRLLPGAFLASTLGPLAIVLGSRALLSKGTDAEIAKSIATIEIFAIAAAITLVTAIFTVGVGCLIVMIMKGPAYVADAYELEDADRPSTGDSRKSD